MFHKNITGNDLHAPSNVLVRNDTVSVLLTLKVVKYTGFNDTVPTVDLIDNLQDVIAGVVQENIDSTKAGLITAFGTIINVDTSSFSVEQNLFATASGDISGTISDVRIGTVLKVDATEGIIFINTVTLANTFRTDAEIKTQYENNSDAEVFVNKSLINSNLLSSHADGFQVTVNTGNSALIDVAAGSIYVTALNGPVGSTGSVVPKAPQIGIAHPAGAVSIVVLDSAGTVTIEPFTGQLSQADKRAGKVQIKIISHLGGLTTSPVDTTFTTFSALFGDTPALNDKLFADGIISQSGLGIVRNADLTIGRDAGNEENPLAPNRFLTPNAPRNVVFTANPLVTFFHSWMGNDINSLNISSFVTDLDPNSWDDPLLAPGTGSPNGTLSGNEAQNFPIHEAISDSGTRFAIQHGRIKYATVAAAASGAVAEMKRINHLQILGTAFRGMLSVARGELNLLTGAVFTPPSDRHVETLRGVE